MKKSKMLDLLGYANDAGILSVAGEILEDYDAPTIEAKKCVDEAKKDIHDALVNVSEYLQAQAVEASDADD